MKKEVIGLLISSLIVVAFLAPIPSLYSPSSLLDLSNPMTGIWSSIYGGRYPAQETIIIPGMESNATIIIDSYGVPNIFTSSERDFAILVGYLHAHDRLFQMDLQRRLVEGRLSEVIGEQVYEMDTFYRTVGLYRGAIKSYDILNNISAGLRVANYSELDVSLVKDDASKLLNLMDAYCIGVNFCINRLINTGTLPVEFKLLGYRPEPWTSLNTLEMGRLMAWGLTGNLAELQLYMIYKALVSKYGESNGTNLLLELMPIDRAIDHFIIPDGTNWSYPLDPSGPPSASGVALPEIDLQGVKEILDWSKSAEPLMAQWRVAYASNNWVVGGNLTNTGKPILCNDPHLDLTVPPVWYEVHYVTKLSSGETLNVRGVTLPGIGLVIIGSNQYVGWAFTNVMADHMDFYYYQWNTGGQYLYNGSWRSVEQIMMEIPVKTGAGMEKREFTLNLTVHGPLLEQGGIRFASCWMGERCGSTESIALLRYAHAKNAHDLLKATYYFQMPPQNTVFADIYGNFGYRAAGWYPNRTRSDGRMAINISQPQDALIARLPINGSSDNVVEWNLNNWIDSNEAPTLWNPTQGYVVTANNRHANKSYPYIYDIAWTFADYYRAYRIDRLINQTIAAKGNISCDDMMKIQNDVFEVPASVFIPEIDLAYLVPPSGDLGAALDLLRNWNCTMLPDLAAPTIFIEWLRIFKNMTYADELIELNQTVPGFIINSEDLDRLLAELPTSILEALTLDDPNSHWFDNVFTAGTTENATLLMQASLNKTVQNLKTKYGADPSDWKFSREHKLNMYHQFHSLLTSFDYPKWAAWGWGDCVNAIGNSGSSGPSWREILNFINLNQSYCIIPGGQSGSPFSPHYYDQLFMWLAGQYKPMVFPASPADVQNKESELTFASR